MAAAGRADCPTDLYYQPTIISGVTTDMLLNREETFGPVAPVLAFEDEDDAIRIAETCPLGLHGSIWTNGIGRALRMSERLRCGTVHVNETSAYWQLHTPTGGFTGTGSGIGRIGGMATLEEMTQLKTISLNVVGVLMNAAVQNVADLRARAARRHSGRRQFQRAARRAQHLLRARRRPSHLRRRGARLYRLPARTGAGVPRACSSGRRGVRRRGAHDRQVYAAQHPLEVEAAEAICDALGWADMVRFNMTGTEAVQAAFRLARAVTGRKRIIRFEGQYHGWLDNVLIKFEPGPAQAASAGQLPEALEATIVVPWNDLDALRAALAEHRHDVAAVITEPMMLNQGAIEPKPGYLAGMKQLVAEAGALLIFDEVITGFRLALGGAAERFGVTPDLAIYGKAIAGGFPVSAIAGKAEFMQRFGTGEVNHSGTFNACVMAAAAVVASLRVLRCRPALCARCGLRRDADGGTAGDRSRDGRAAAGGGAGHGVPCLVPQGRLACRSCGHGPARAQDTRSRALSQVCAGARRRRHLGGVAWHLVCLGRARTARPRRDADALPRGDPVRLMAGTPIGDGGPRDLPLSMAYRAGDFVFVSGQVGFGNDGRLVTGGIEAETRQTLENIVAALRLANASLSDVVKVTVWLADLDDFPLFNSIYRSYFPATPPARSTIQAGLMVNARVEIEVVAFAPDAQAD